MTSTWSQRRSHWGVMIKPMVRRQRRLYTMATLRRTFARGWRDRILGLAAEAGFWQLLSLPPLLLAVLGTIGYFAGLTGHSAVDSIEHSILQAAEPLPDRLDRAEDGQADDRRHPAQRPPRRHLDRLHHVAVVGLVGDGHLREHHHDRLRRTPRARRGQEPPAGASALHPAGALRRHPAARAGARARPSSTGCSASTRRHGCTMPSPSSTGRSPSSLALVILATLYHLSVPHRRRWRSALPGAVFALVIWSLGSWALRSYIRFVFAHTIAYGALAAPVAVLLFLYITALAVLLGAELNATLDLTREELERIDRERAAAPGRCRGIRRTGGSRTRGGRRPKRSARCGSTNRRRSPPAPAEQSRLSAAGQ